MQSRKQTCKSPQKQYQQYSLFSTLPRIVYLTAGILFALAIWSRTVGLAHHVITVKDTENRTFFYDVLP